MKKKIISLCLVLALALTAIGGATLAYFTDTDVQTNTFTTGNVKIDLFEDFGDNFGVEKLLPATGSAQNGTLKNGVDKEVYVKNIGTEDAYVRVHIAIPQVLDNGADTFDAGKNVLHFNYAKDSIGEGKWNWSKSTGKPYEGDWNYYETTINRIPYNVYVVTYETALKGKTTKNVDGKDVDVIDVTVDAIHQMYLDAKVTNEDINKIINGVKKDDSDEYVQMPLGDKWYVYVAAEACQKEGFANAYEALNATFGTPSMDPSKYTSKVDWNGIANKSVSPKGDTFLSWTSVDEAKAATPVPGAGE